MMSVDARAQSTAPQANGSFPGNCDDTKILLSYKLASQQQVPSESGLLHIPYEMMELYTKKPRKWLLFVAKNICGVDGRLRSLSEYEDFTEQEWNKVLMRGTRHSQSSVSTRSRTEPKDLKNFYGGRPFTHWGPEAPCDACHLVPHVKGDEYLRKLLTDRGEPDNSMSIDDCQDLILLQKGLHAIFDKAGAIAFLKTPNKFLKTDEIPGGEDAEPDDYLVTIQCFLGDEYPCNTYQHGEHSDMSSGAGLDSPLHGEVNEGFRPNTILLDMTYASSVLRCFGCREAKEKAKKDAKDNYYPNGLPQRGEDKEGKVRKSEEESQSQEKEGNASRNKRAISRAGAVEDASGQATKGEKGVDMWDWMLMARYMFRGIRPADIEASEKERKAQNLCLAGHH